MPDNFNSQSYCSSLRNLQWESQAWWLVMLCKFKIIYILLLIWWDIIIIMPGYCIFYIGISLLLREFESEDEDSTQESVSAEEKCILFYLCLHFLLAICIICQSSCEVVKKCCIGTQVSFKSTCVNGHVRLWNSQPLSGNMPWGNLICASGILFSGCNPYKIFNYFKNINVQFIAPRTYHLLQKHYITPSIFELWERHQSDILQSLLNKKLVLGGDGRCDSPGHSAKYGSYSFIDLNSNKVLDVQLVQVSNVYFNMGTQTILQAAQNCNYIVYLSYTTAHLTVHCQHMFKLYYS